MVKPRSKARRCRARSSPGVAERRNPERSRAAAAVPAAEEHEWPLPFELAGGAREKPSSAFDTWPVDRTLAPCVDDAPDVMPMTGRT